MITVKLSDETLKAIGATAADAEEKIVALAKANATLTAQNEGFSALASEVTAKFTAFESRFTALENRKVEAVMTVADRTALTDAIAAAKAEARIVAASEVAAVIAKAGVQSIKAGDAEDGKVVDFPACVKAKVTAGMTQSDAIMASVKEFPEAFAIWKKTGGNL